MKFYLPNLDTQHHSPNLHSLENDQTQIPSQILSASPIVSGFSCPIASPDMRSIQKSTSFYNFDDEESRIEERGTDATSEESVLYHDDAEYVEWDETQHESAFGGTDVHGRNMRRDFESGTPSTLRQRHHPANVTIITTPAEEVPLSPPMTPESLPSLQKNSSFTSNIHFAIDKPIGPRHRRNDSAAALLATSHARMASYSSNLSTLSPYTTSYMKYHKFVDDSATGDNSMRFSDTPLEEMYDTERAVESEYSAHDQHSQYEEHRSTSLFSSIFNALISPFVPSLRYSDLEMGMKKRRQIDTFFTQYWRILKCPHAGSKRKHTLSTRLPSTSSEDSISPPDAYIPFLPFSFLHPSATDSPQYSSSILLIVISLFIAFILFIFIHYLPPTSVYSLDDSTPGTLSILQSYAFVFISFVLLGVLYQNKHLWESHIHVQHQHLLAEVEAFHSNLKQFNSKIQSLMSLILEVQLIAKGYQIVFPLNAEIVSNLEWNEYSLGQEQGSESRGVGAYSDLRRVVLTNLLKLNEYFEMCIEHIRRNVGVEHEFFDDAGLMNSLVHGRRKMSTVTPSTPSSTSADYSLSLKYLKLKHLELKQNAQTLSQILVHIFQQSQLSSLVPNHVIVHSFDELLRSPLIGLSSVFDECIGELKACEKFMVGIEDQAPKDTTNQTPVQVLTQQYFLSRMNTSLSELRAHLNLFQHMRCDLRDEKVTVEECARIYQRIRTDLIEDLRQSFDESALFYLKSVTSESDREKHHSKTGELWEEKSASNPKDRSTIDQISDEPTLYNSLQTPVETRNNQRHFSKENIQSILTKKTPVYVFEPTEEAPQEVAQDAAFRLPSMSLLSASKKRRVMIAKSVSDDEAEDCAPSPPDLGACLGSTNAASTPVLLGEKQQTFLKEMASSVAKSQKEPKTLLLSEMKNVLSKRSSRDLEFHKFDE